MDTETIEKILPSSEAKAYVYLVHNAPKKASDVAKILGSTRPLAYQVLDSLIEKNLLVKHKVPGKPAVYNPQHPLNLQSLFEQEERHIKEKAALLEAALPELITKFHLRFGGIPGTRIFSGQRGVSELYEDILNEGKDILLIRFLDDRKHPEVGAMVRPQMVAQTKAGIRVRSISPYHQNIPRNHDEWYGKYNIEQRIVSPERFSTPAQIIVYGNKVALTSFGEVVVTTIIEDHLITETLRSVFEFIWTTSLADHEHYMKIVLETHEMHT